MTVASRAAILSATGGTLGGVVVLAGVFYAAPFWLVVAAASLCRWCFDDVLPSGRRPRQKTPSKTLSKAEAVPS